MQARLELVRLRIPALFFAIVFALAAALSLGAVLGYTLKPSVVTPAVPRVVIIHDSTTTSPAGADCIWIEHQKAC